MHLIYTAQSNAQTGLCPPFHTSLWGHRLCQCSPWLCPFFHRSSERLSNNSTLRAMYNCRLGPMVSWTGWLISVEIAFGRAPIPPRRARRRGRGLRAQRHGAATYRPRVWGRLDIILCMFPLSALSSQGGYEDGMFNSGVYFLSQIEANPGPTFCPKSRFH